MAGFDHPTSAIPCHSTPSSCPCRHPQPSLRSPVPPRFSWARFQPSPEMAPPPGPGRVGAGTVKQPPSTGTLEEDVIDVDALPPVAVAPHAEDNGPAAAFSRNSERLLVEQPINVDDPETLAKLATASVGGPSGGGGLQPTLKFDGLLGEVLLEQKTEVKNEEAAAACASTSTGQIPVAPAEGTGVPGAAPVSCAGGNVLEEAATTARAEVVADMGAANRVREAVVAAISQDRNKQLQMPWPPHAPRVLASLSHRRRDGGPSAGPVAPIPDSLADLSGHRRTENQAPMACVLPQTMEMPPAQRSLFGSSPRRSSLPRRPRRSFVRRAAVMVAPPYVPRMFPDPPTPPQAGSSVAAGSSECHDDGGAEGADGDDEQDYPDGECAPDQATVEGGGASGDVVSGADEADNDVGGSGESPPTKGVCVDGVRSGPDPLASGVEVGPPTLAGRVGAGGLLSSPSNPCKRAAHEMGAPAGARAVPGTRTSSDVLAEQLAAQSRNPTLFPATCWVPGAREFFSAAQAARVQAGQAARERSGLPPTGSVVAGGSASTGANIAPSSGPTGVRTPQPPSPIMPPMARTQGQVPSPSLPVDESSSDMNDDDLVLAYVTPPASPSLAARGSPRSARPSSGRRRRAGTARAARGEGSAAAGVASAAAVHEMPVPLTSREVYDAVRAGFSSIRRELTRYRTELVVVKSQSASVLRRMDGISAAVDGTESGNGAMMERVAGLEKAISALAQRLPVAGDGSAQPGASGEMSPSLINDIKVGWPGMSRSSARFRRAAGLSICRLAACGSGMGGSWNESDA